MMICIEKAWCQNTRPTSDFKPKLNQYTRIRLIHDQRVLYVYTRILTERWRDPQA